ncbi:MAG: histidinol-phosphate transaminase [Muribaculaceae bacterium]|nr:histidinol-phosphate transaminase [Muribaculaceae bacterium]
MKELKEIVRKNIYSLKPYSSARNEFKGEASIFIDANENPYDTPYNRYPDPLQLQVKEKISALKGVAVENIFLGVGSDEPIDLLYRIFCEPQKDNVVALEPTYGMYAVCADINNVEYRTVSLKENYQFSAEELLAATDDNSKIIWLCSPNNPTGNALDAAEIEKVLKNFSGIVAVDEAYIDFSSQPSYLKVLKEYPNMVVLQTFSKAWGSAGVRLGMAFASEDIIKIFNKVKYPYNVNVLTQRYAIKLLDNFSQVEKKVKAILKNREKLEKQLAKIKCIKEVYPTDANFILVKTIDSDAIYKYLIEKGIVARNRNGITLCDNCLRITVGTAEENKQVIAALKNFSK